MINDAKAAKEEQSFVNEPEEIKADISYVSCTHVTTGERRNMQAMVLNKSPYIQENITAESQWLNQN